jgi:hypothetical protein
MELHTVVAALPTGDPGDIDPVVLTTIGVGMVPNGVDDVVVVDDVIVAVVPGIDVEPVVGIVDGTGTGTGVIEGDGRDGTAGGGGAGMVVPGKTLMNDVSGCWENVNDAITPPVIGVEELAGSADVAGAAETDGIVPIALPVADVEGAVKITDTVEVPGAI